MVSFSLSLKMRIAVTTSNTELRDYTFTGQFRVEVKRSDAINNHVQFSRHYISSWFLQLHNIFNSIWLFPSYLLTLSLQFPAGIFRRSHQRCSVKKGVPEKFNKIHWKTPVPESFHLRATAPELEEVNIQSLRCDTIIIIIIIIINISFWSSILHEGIFLFL